MPLRAVAPTPDELAASERWCADHFDLASGKAPVELPAGLLVLANHDPVQHNARGGKPLNLAGKSYTHGLYCHAVSEILVRLPAPGKTFTALAGIDSNADTTGGRGNVMFSVDVAGKTAFKSALLHEGMPAAPVEVNLDGATEFTLKIGDAGLGISCDQSDWADARVTLQDGREIWLGDLPQITQPPGVEPFSFLYGDKPSSALLGQWSRTQESRAIDAQRTMQIETWTDPASHLVVRCESIRYKDFPVIEWTLHFRNAGQSDSAILLRVESIDTELMNPGNEGHFILHHSRGSPAAKLDYEPMESSMDSPGARAHFSAAGGRPTNMDMPYFNVQSGGGRGTIAVIGWPGQWSADFARKQKNRFVSPAGRN